MSTVRENQKLAIVARYIQLKRAEKAASDAAADFKGVFIRAIDALNTPALELDGALVYSRELPRYNYPSSIQALEKALEAEKAAFREKNQPAAVVLSWAVKF